MTPENLLSDLSCSVVPHAATCSVCSESTQVAGLLVLVLSGTSAQFSKRTYETGPHAALSSTETLLNERTETRMWHAASGPR